MAQESLPPSRFGTGYTAGVSHSLPAAASGPVAAPLDKLAAVTFIAALLLGPLATALTLPLSCVAIRRIGDSQKSGAWLARAALMISGVYLVLGVAVAGLYWYVAFVSTPA